MEIKNVQIFGLKESLIAAGLPKAANYEEYMAKQIKAVNVAPLQNLGVKLGNAPIGSGHDCFLKGIRVQADVKYTQYWSMQFQRYHFADIISSQSKMHRIIEMGLNEDNTNELVDPVIRIKINEKILTYRALKAEGKDKAAAEMFLSIMANIPMGFMLWMRIDLNYLQLKTIYAQRKNGDAKRLPDDWGVFCNWCETLPLFKELCINKLTH